MKHKLWQFFTSSKIRRILFLALFLGVSAVALTWFLEYRYFINDSTKAWNFFAEKNLVFWYSALLMFLGLLFFTGISRRPAISVGVMWGAIIILSYVHINKFNSRGFPLLPEDFQMAGEASSLSKFIDFGELIRMILALILVGFLTFLLNRWMRNLFLQKKSKTEKNLWKRWGMTGRIALIVVSGGLLVGMTDFVRNHDGQRYEDITWLKSQLVAWNQVKNYDENGFILGFLYNLQKYKLSEPEGYSEEAVDEIKDNYQSIADKSNMGKKSAAEEDINVVVILNESFYDPSVKFNGYAFEDYYPHSGGEVLPNWKNIQANYPSGHMYSTDYGGGTANIEFEVLTGLSNYFVNTVPYTDLLPKAENFPSMASFFEEQGYKTTAIHPFNGSMYKRNIVYENFGYDKFITELEMDYREKDGTSEYINDRSAYNQVLDTLNENDGNQFVTLVTMQNHLPYNPGTYKDTQFSVLNDNLSADKKSEIATYYQTLHNSDKYLGEFISKLNESDEKTAVLFFGDHSAGIFDITNGNQKKEVRDLSRLTPYFVYTNFDSETEQDIKLNTTTPNCLGNTLFNVLNVKKPKIDYLLDEICAESPILTNSWLGEVAAEKTKALESYQLVIYDLLGGKRYWGR